MTKDEFILYNLRDQRGMYRVIFLVCVGAAIAALVLGIVLIVMRGEWVGALTFASMMIFFAMQALTAKAQYESYDAALDEVGDEPAGIYLNRTYSASTVSLIAHSWLPAKTYFGQILAYGACALLMYGMAPVVFYAAAEEESAIFVALGALVVAGGIWLTILAAQAYRNWRAVKLFDQEDSSQS